MHISVLKKGSLVHILGVKKGPWCTILGLKSLVDAHLVKAPMITGTVCRHRGLCSFHSDRKPSKAKLQGSLHTPFP